MKWRERKTKNTHANLFVCIANEQRWKSATKQKKIVRQMALIWICWIFGAKHCGWVEWNRAHLQEKQQHHETRSKQEAKICRQHIFRELPGNRSSPIDNAIILANSFRSLFSFFFAFPSLSRFTFCYRPLVALSASIFHFEIKVNVIHQRTSGNANIKQ